MKKNLFALLLAGIIAVSGVSFTGCNSNNGTETTATTTTATNENEAVDGMTSFVVQELGEGDTAFAFNIKAKDDGYTYYSIHTNEKTVGAALIGLNLIAGEVGEYGLYVTSVNGITADYNTDKSYWAFYVDDVYAVSAVDKTNIKDGEIYAFVYTQD